MGSLSLIMLFGDTDRWGQFAKLRFEEARMSNIFDEIVFVINKDDLVTRELVLNCVAEFHGLHLNVIFNDQNNIPQGRNLGVVAARNDNLLVWDDDDSCNPIALTQAYKAFVSYGIPIMEIPLGHCDGDWFHPQDEQIMPQAKVAEDLLAIGMMHTPFFCKREMVVENPMPEYVPLRGDWLHWSAQLWSAGIPIFCWTGSIVAIECNRIRVNGATASNEPNDFATHHVFVSLILLFVLCDVPLDSVESALIKKRYFDKYCKENSVWLQLVHCAKSLRNKGSNGVQLESPLLYSAYKHVAGLVDSGNVNPSGLSYKLAPFEIFQEDNHKTLCRIIKNHFDLFVEA